MFLALCQCSEITVELVSAERTHAQVELTVSQDEFLHGHCGRLISERTSGRNSKLVKLDHRDEVQ